MRRIGYARVAASSRTKAGQDDAMAELGVDRLYTEKIGGRNADRSELRKMIEFVREGDIVVVADISRLARSARDLLSIVDALRRKKADFVSLKEKIDTTSPRGRFLLTVFEALSELERENIHSRQKEGIQAAKAGGKHLGRPFMEYPENWEKAYASWKKGKIRPTEAAKELKLKRPTFYNMVKRWEANIQ